MPSPYPTVELQLPVADAYFIRRLIRAALAYAAWWCLVIAFAFVHHFSLHRPWQTFPWIVVALYSGVGAFNLLHRKWWSEGGIYSLDSAGIRIGDKNGANLCSFFTYQYVLQWSTIRQATMIETTWNGLPCLLVLKEGYFGMRVSATLVVRSLDELVVLRNSVEKHLALTWQKRLARQIN